MSPLFMESVCEAGSPGSLSAEEDHSNAAGSGREGGPPRGSKRREKNRNAARKSRQKQTERADELHKELQSLEQSNSALHKEIDALKKDLHKYETVLKRHEPHCCLGALPGGPAHPSTEASSSYPGNQNSSVPFSQSHSASVTSSKSHKILKGIEKPRFQCAAPLGAPFPSAAAPAAELLAVSSSPGAVPSHDLYAHSASLFSLTKEPPVTSKATNASLFSPLLNTPPSSSTAAHLQPPVDVRQTAPVTVNARFTAGTFPTDQESLFSASAVTPFYSHPKVDPHGALAQEAPRPHPFDFSGSSDPLTSLLLPPLESPVPRLLPAAPQPSLEPPPAPGFGLALPAPPPPPPPLLSQLIVPAPLDISQATSSNFDGPLGPLVQSQPPPREPASDLFLLEMNAFLETNEWIFGGTSDK